eukprot:756805-Hanusia_phi.AAC.3
MTAPDPSLLKSNRQAYFEQATGEAHWICRNPAVVKELLWLWKFTGQPTVKFLQGKILEQAASCLNCAFQLHQARTSAIEDDEQSEFDELGLTNRKETSRCLATCLDEWDCERFSSMLAVVSSASMLVGRQLDQVLCTIIEVLLRPRILSCNITLWKSFNHVMRLLIYRKEGLQISGALKLPGVYMLCAHDDQILRDWARSHVKSMGTLDSFDDPPALEWVVDEIVNRIINGLNKVGDDEKFSRRQNDGRDYIFSGDDNVVSNSCCGLVEILIVSSAVDCNSCHLAADELADYQQSVFATLSGISSDCDSLRGREVQDSLCGVAMFAAPDDISWERLLGEKHVQPSLHEENPLRARREVCRHACEEDSAGDPPGSCLLLLLHGPFRGSSMQFAADPTIGSLSVKVLVNLVNRMLDNGSIRKLPLVSAHQWIPHLLGAVCSLNLPPAVRQSPLKTIQRLMELQTGNLRFLLRGDLQPARSSPQSPPLSSDSPEWLGSMWEWLLLKAGVTSIPPELHASILRTASTILPWLDVNRRLDGGMAGAASLPVRDAILVRFAQLFLQYAQQLPQHPAVLEQVNQQEDVMLSCFALSVIANVNVRDAVVRLLLACFVPWTHTQPQEGPSRAMTSAVRSHPDLFACGFCGLLEEVEQVGLDGVFFPLLEHLFRVGGDVVSEMICMTSEDRRKRVLLLLWRLLKSFMNSRSRLFFIACDASPDIPLCRFRGERFQSSSQYVYFDRVTESFFFLFNSSWRFLKDFAPEDEGDRESDEEFDPRSSRTLLSAHEEWLGVLAKWGGVANLQIRQAWCTCLLHVLQTLRQDRQELDADEKELFRKLVQRRNLWTDEQILLLCRELVPLGVPGLGNLGQSSLHALPSTSGSSRASQGGQRRAADARTVEVTTMRPKEGTTKRKKNKEEAPRSSRGVKEQRVGGVKEQRVGGLQAILANLSGSRGQQGDGEQGGSGKLTVGNLVMDISTSMKGAIARDALGTRSRRTERSLEELEVELLLLVLAWDLRLDRLPHALRHREVPVQFAGLDEYEDTLTSFLLEESWEQVKKAFEEARSLLLDTSSLKVCVASYEGDENFNSFVMSLSSTAKEEESLLDDLAENDLVLLAWVRRSDRERGKRTGSLQGDDEPEHAVGIVEKPRGLTRGGGGGEVRSRLRIKIGAHINPRLKRLNSRFVREIRAGQRDGGEKAEEEEEGDVVLVPLNHNFSTALREFVALHSVRSLPASMQRLILDPMADGDGGGQGGVGVPEDPRIRFLPKSSLNDDQLTAIRSCLDPRRSFNLIQGPPGTGKTRTILALVTALLGPAARAAGSEEADLRILICAPSNAAVDEVRAPALPAQCFLALLLPVASLPHLLRPH